MAISTALLLEELEVAAAEKALLMFSDAPTQELRNAQNRIDQLKQELFRRMAW